MLSSMVLATRGVQPVASNKAPADTDAPSAHRPVDFDAIYEEHFDAVSRFLLALGVPTFAVDDAVQDVFLVAYRRLGDFEGRSTVKTWLFGIAMRVASDVRRRNRRKAAPAPLDHDPEDPSLLPDDLAARAEAIVLMRKLLASLDEEQRTVYVLAELEQLSGPEIAELVNAPVNTVYSRLRLARNTIAQAARNFQPEARQ